jgi:SOS-response transcriptional repressor LexA
MEAMATENGISTGTVNGFLTARDARATRSFYRCMLEQLLERIERRLTALNISAQAASKRANLSEDAIRNLQRAVAEGKRKGVSTKTITGLARALQTSTSWLLDGEGPEHLDDEVQPKLVRILGRVGANPEAAVNISDDAWDMAPLPPGATSKAVALEVSGVSMHTQAPDGSLVYFENQETPPTPDLLGMPCVVETEDGRVLYKRLLRGSAPGLYDLESEVGNAIRDVRLRWAAEVIAVIPPRQAKRIIVRNGEAA